MMIALLQELCTFFKLACLKPSQFSVVHVKFIVIKAVFDVAVIIVIDLVILKNNSNSSSYISGSSKYISSRTHFSDNSKQQIGCKFYSNSAFFHLTRAESN